jgi:hypothetical protein
MKAAIVFLIVSLFSSYSLSQSLTIAQFENEDLSSWEKKSFVGETQYSIVADNGQKVLKANSQQSASGIAKEVQIDLKKTPFLNWSWRVDSALPNLDEQSKDGDDYSARIYLVKSGGFFIWKTKALNYVWSGNQLKGSEWDNAFVGDKARMMAVRGVEDKPGEWHSEKRNVYLDMIRLFGDQGSDEANEKAYRFLDAVAIMTDTDNSGLNATAYYGDIFFSEN